MPWMRDWQFMHGLVWHLVEEVQRRGSRRYRAGQRRREADSRGRSSWSQWLWQILIMRFLILGLYAFTH
jgi:hypothetical protein